MEPLKPLRLSSFSCSLLKYYISVKKNKKINKNNIWAIFLCKKRNVFRDNKINRNCYYLRAGEGVIWGAGDIYLGAGVKYGKIDLDTHTGDLIKSGTAEIEFVGTKFRNSGTATFSGDGATTQFTIAHGLVSTPSNVQITPMSSDASGSFYVTVDATNIYVHYITAPASGTNNVVLSWYAEV